jgi:hypothetical protein
VSLLLDAGADRDAVDMFGATPLWAAASAGHGQLVPLLTTPDNINKPDQVYNRTPVSAAAGAGHEQAVAALLAAGARADWDDSKGYSGMITLARRGHWGVVRLLLASLAADCRQHPKEQARLVSSVTDTARLLAMQHYQPHACSQLLEVVLDVSGPEVLQQVCVEVQQQLKQEFEQPTPQARQERASVWDGGPKYYLQVAWLAEALLLGWVRAQQRLHAARQPVVATLQRLVLRRGNATGQQQQHLVSRGRGGSCVSSWRRCIKDLLLGMLRLPEKLLCTFLRMCGGGVCLDFWHCTWQVEAAVYAAAVGDGEAAHRLLGEAWCLYVQHQRGVGVLSNAGSGGSLHPVGPTQGTSPGSDITPESNPLGRPLKLIRVGLHLASQTLRKDTDWWLRKPAVSRAARQQGLNLWAPGVYSTFLDAWVAARQELQQVPRDVADTVVAAVTAAQQRQQQQQQQWGFGRSGWAAAVRARRMEVRAQLLHVWS